MPRSHSERAIRVMGPILFPVTLPVGTRVPAGAGLSPRIAANQEFLAKPAPRLPRHNGMEAPTAFGAASLLLHATVLASILALGASGSPSRDGATRARQSDAVRLVFLVQPVQPGLGGGGGGGGNRRREPVPRARARGRDPVTVPVDRPIAPTSQPREEVPTLQALALDAKPLASALDFQIGSLDGARTLGTSQGQGSGDGVGEGIGTGIGSGRGPGLGPGSGGGTGGGVYRPGGGVTSPTLLMEVKPTYSADALRAKIQGSVLLAAIVQRDGTPRDIRVIRSLDPGGLDQQAVLAVEQWRFAPGRLNGTPVDVLVTIILDFQIR